MLVPRRRPRKFTAGGIKLDLIIIIIINTSPPGFRNLVDVSMGNEVLIDLSFPRQRRAENLFAILISTY